MGWWKGVKERGRDLKREDSKKNKKNERKKQGERRWERDDEGKQGRE